MADWASEADSISKDVRRVVGEGDGCWVPCTGCYETEDGRAVGKYPHSSIFDCALGGGCSECGGLGGVWDNTDYAAFGDALAVEAAERAGGGPAIDDAMVERVQLAWMRSDFVNVPGDSTEFDELVRLLLAAALRADGDGS